MLLKDFLRRFSPTRAAAVTAATLLVLAPPTYAGWPSNGVTVGGSQAKGNNPQAIFDGFDGWYIVWEDHQIDTSHPDIRLQHLGSQGDPVAGWPASGVVVSGGPTDELLPQLASDGAGGVVVTWQDRRSGNWDVYVQRYSSDGTLRPGWPAGGVRATGAPGGQAGPQIASDGLGGAFIVWGDLRLNINNDPTQCYGQHITGDGLVAAGWPTDGLEIYSGHMSHQRILPDGSGGCFVTWEDYRRAGGVYPDGFDVYGQHLLPDGSIAPGWQTDGNLLVLKRGARDLLPDGTGGFYEASVQEDSQGSEVRYWLSRFTPSGVSAPGWTMDGIAIQSTTAYRGELSCAPDLLGGVFAAWDDNAQGGDIYAVRILPNGSVAPGWLPDGTRISDPANFDEYTSSVGPDGAGGAYFAWEKIIDGLYTRSYAQHFGAQGTLFPGWPVGGVALSSSNFPQVIPKVASDGVGNALVYWLEKATMAQLFETDGIVATSLSLASSDVRPERVALVWQGVGAGQLAAQVERRQEGGEWQRIGTTEHDGPDRLRFEDTHVTAAMRYAYRLGYLESGSEQFTTETWIDVPSAAVFALDGLRPNPAVDAINVSFSLPTASPASVELLDLAGRRVLDREVGPLGAGRHQLRLDSGEHLAPGVYWLRLRQGAQQALIRAVVMR